MVREFFVKKLWRGVLTLAVAATLVAAPAVHADDYGNGAYGSDVYGSSSKPSSGGSTPRSAASSSTTEPTVIKTESGLEVAINLTDGQAIPPTGYYITITPLNGQGKSFDKAEIYLDGELAYTGAPDSTGTLKWLWDTAANPATKVKIVVFGPGSGTTTHDFNVTVTPVASATTQAQDTTTPAATPATNGGWPLWLILGGLAAVVVLVGLALWLIARRRRNQLPPPTPFTPLQ